jgi:hypothetical protein
LAKKKQESNVLHAFLTCRLFFASVAPDGSKDSSLSLLTAAICVICSAAIKDASGDISKGEFWDLGAVGIAAAPKS